MNLELFSAFLVITVVLFLTPGPIVTLVITTGARLGSRAALLTVAGASVGNAVLLAFIAFGLSWILKTSAEIIDYLRWFGAAYLVWLGIQAWRHAGAAGETSAPRGHVHAWRGFIVAITNPKSIAFFTAFLPQFIDPALPAERQLLVRRVGVDGRCAGFMLGRGRELRPGLVHEAAPQQAARPHFRRSLDRRRHLAVASAAAGLVKPFAAYQADFRTAELRADAMQIGPGLVGARAHGGLDRLGHRPGIDRAWRRNQGHHGGNGGGGQDGCDRFEHGNPHCMTVSTHRSRPAGGRFTASLKGSLF
jgi:homoserine/homoserine lactone efflux protein